MSDGDRFIAGGDRIPGNPWAPRSMPSQREFTFPPVRGAQRSQAGGPVVEVHLSESAPYEQQTVLLTLEIASEQNIQTIQPQTPTVAGAVVELIDGPKTEARPKNGRQMIVTEFRYAVTPLRPGELVIPPVEVSGTMASARSSGAFGYPGGNWLGRQQPAGGSFATQSAGSRTLRVRPAASLDHPWLPLHDLSIRAHIEPHGNVAAGEPLTLTVEVAGVGASGERLPSFRSLLNTADFNVYSEDVRQERSISPGGKQLMGYRTETYTLVPQHGGDLTLPAVRVPWWNLDTQAWDWSVLPEHAVSVSGSMALARTVLGSHLSGVGARLDFWLGLLGVFAGMLFSWFWIWTRAHGGGARLRAWFAARTQSSRMRLAETLGRMSFIAAPVRGYRAVQRGLSRKLPTSVRVWYHLRCVDREKEPSVWCQMLARLVGPDLQLSEHAPVHRVAEEVIHRYRGVDASELRRLVTELDGAIYGSKPIAFPAWKKAFRRQLRAALLRGKSRGSSRALAVLPDLNPTKA